MVDHMSEKALKVVLLGPPFYVKLIFENNSNFNTVNNGF